MQIKIVVTMGEYKKEYIRKRAKLKECKSIYGLKCSTSQNYVIFLSKFSYPGKENISIRVKYFDLRLSQYLQKQMHSKYMIVDQSHLLTGSFNWSYSSEYNHLENLISMSGEEYFSVIDNFAADFSKLWDLNRESYSKKLDEINQYEKVKCGFDPISLNLKEIDFLLKSAKQNRKKVNEICL